MDDRKDVNIFQLFSDVFLRKEGANKSCNPRKVDLFDTAYEILWYLFACMLLSYYLSKLPMPLCLLRVDNSLWSTSRPLQRPAVAKPYTSSFTDICRVNPRPRFMLVLLTASCVSVLIRRQMLRHS